MRRSAACASGVGVGLVALATVLLAGPAGANSFGPLDGNTGAPAESTCASGGCHDSFQLDEGPGSVAIVVPAPIIANETYEIEVHVSQDDQMRWGFQLTVLDELGDRAGALAVLDANTRISDAPSTGRQYIKQTSTGTSAGQADANVWMFEWTAPEEGEVTFYAAGNAANNDFTRGGDYVYTTQITVEVPEPASLAGTSAALIACAALGLRRRSERA